MLTMMQDFCMQALCTVSLNLRGNNVGSMGAKALAGLKDAHALQTLILDLEENNVGSSGTQALAGLQNAETPHTLILGRRCNDLGHSGAQALAMLKDPPTLHTQSLNSASNKVGAVGARTLAGLRYSADFVFFGIHSPEVAKVSSRVLCYTAGAPPGSYSIFKAGLPLARRGGTAFSCQYYRVCRPATATPSN